MDARRAGRSLDSWPDRTRAARHRMGAIDIVASQVMDPLERGLDLARSNRPTTPSAPLALCGACTHMHALTLRAEEAEEFDGRRAGSPEPVRDAGVELG